MTQPLYRSLRPLAFSLLLLVATLTVGLRGQDRATSTSLGGLLKHSDIALMPEGTSGSPDSMLPLRPTVVAWGNDSVSMLNRPQALKQRMNSYRAMGIRLLACNVWMLTATDRVLYAEPKYQDAVCVDIAGDRIVPPWLDASYKGVKPYWGCTNHPLFRQQVIARAEAGIVAGANMLHLDDHLGTAAASQFAGACFCDHCMHGFRNWLKQQHSAAELNALGISRIDSFDYRRLVRDSGFTTLEQYQQACWSNKLPLRERFLAFQREAASNFVEELGELATKLAGRHVPVGVNAFNLSPTQISDAHVADYFANEVEHYDVEDTIPPLVYKLGDAFGKPVFSTGAGHDWIQIGEQQSVTRVQRWIATAHACGHYFMYAQSKWGFTKETGTRWYATPIATYQPLTRFITNNAELFDGYEPTAQLGVLYSNYACFKNHWEVRQVCRDLHYANIPFSLAIAGDQRLQMRLTGQQLAQFEHVVVPQPTLLEGDQKKLLDEWIEQGKATVWTNIQDTKKRITPWLSVHGSDKVWALPRVKPSAPHAPLVIHLLNQDYNAQSDQMRPAQDLQLRISKALLKTKPATTATLFTPGNKPMPLTTEKVSGALTLSVPRLDLWGIIRVSGQ